MREKCWQLVLLATLALLLGACSQSTAAAHSTTTPLPTASLSTATPLPTVPSAGQAGGTVLPSPTALPNTVPLGAAPQNCPDISPLQSVAPTEFGGAAGNDPVWVSGFTGATATLRLGAGATHGQFGWAGSLQWNVHLPFHGPVTIQGQAQSGVAAALWFQSGALAATTEPTLQPSQAGPGSDASWDKFPLAIFIPQAGCYVITAIWHDGSARIIFAAGQ